MEPTERKLTKGELNHARTNDTVKQVRIGVKLYYDWIGISHTLAHGY